MSLIAALQLVLGGDEVLGGVDVDLEPLDQQLAGQRIDLDDALDLVAEELDAHGDLLVGGEDLQRVAADAERCRGRESCRCGRTGCRSDAARSCRAAPDRRGEARRRF